MASIGRRLRAQVVERPGDSAAAHTCYAQVVQGCVGVEGKLTVWSLKVAEYEHQFKTIDEAQKIFVVREMMPKEIKREFLTGPRRFDEIMEKLEIIVNEMMAGDGPVPVDLENVGVHDTKATQSDSDEQRHVIRRRVRHCLERIQSRQGSRQEGTEWIGNVASWERGWPSGRRDDGGKKEGKKGSEGSKPDW